MKKHLILSDKIPTFKSGMKLILSEDQRTTTFRPWFSIFLIFVSLIALWPFFRKGFYTSHDGEWMIIRFTAFHQTLAAGQFPVRFVDRLNNNYGYPVLNFL